jgi:hypothetical protein
MVAALPALAGAIQGLPLKGLPFGQEWQQQQVLDPGQPGAVQATAGTALNSVGGQVRKLIEHYVRR